MRRLFSLILVLGLLAGIGKAQLNEIGTMMLGGKDDAQKLFKAYITPYANGFGANLNAGWYNTAKVHGMLGFDVTLTLNMAFVPEADKTFDATKLGLSQNAVIEGSTCQTAAGSRDKGAKISYFSTVNNAKYQLASYNSPQGTGVSFVPLPMVKASVGLPMKTELMLRGLPTLKIGDSGTFGFIGAGIKHDLMQYIPLGEWIPFINASAMLAYTKLWTGADLDYQLPTSDNQNAPKLENKKDQKFEVNMSCFTGNLLLSADLPMITIYAGGGVSLTSTKLKLSGTYPIYVSGTTLESPVKADNLVDPLDIEIDNKSGSTAMPNVTIGAKFKFLLFTFHADYTYASYSVFSTGIGVSFR